jgi:hypothetical protein
MIPSVYYRIGYVLRQSNGVARGGEKFEVTPVTPREWLARQREMNQPITMLSSEKTNHEAYLMYTLMVARGQHA